MEGANEKKEKWRARSNLYVSLPSSDTGTIRSSSPGGKISRFDTDFLVKVVCYVEISDRVTFFKAPRWESHQHTHALPKGWPISVTNLHAHSTLHS